MTDDRRGSVGPDDLPTVNGRVYHLDLAPEELAPHILLMGDPERVPLLADRFLAAREVDRSHRGFRTITGTCRESGLRVSLVSTGIGAPSTEIVLNELAALNEIDFATMGRRERFQPLTLIRVGTSGGLNPATAVGTLALTDYAIGLDNSGLFYDVPSDDPLYSRLEEEAARALARAGAPGARFRGRVVPYAARADRRLLETLARVAGERNTPHVRGITISSPGFFAEQGRGVARIPSPYPRLLDELAAMECGAAGLRVENMEMEAAFALHFLGGLGYRAAAICVLVNSRQTGSFLADARPRILEAADIALRTLTHCAADH